ncbi:MAG: dicarboxylate/amino acid:cation symporter [Oscillospiraceae bacterium]|nr:dicarboxylate/amino acid:cation symporter [Oscillospiraceae bacterium]
MMKKIKSNLALQIFISLVLAILVGLLMGREYATYANSYIKPFGTIFLNLLKFIVCPIVLFSILCGMISMKDIRKVGSIGLKTIVYYMLTTAVAIVIGLAMGQLMKGFFPALSTTDLSYEAKEATPFMDTLVDIFPSNFLSPLVNANMLQIIVIALFIGFGIILVGEKANAVRTLIEQLNEVFMKVMELILKLSPLGVFCLLTPVVAENGAEIIGSLAMVLLTAYISYVIHALVVYSSTVRALGNKSPLEFFKGMAPAMIFAFSSASSVGTLPLNMECCEKLGADKEITAFVLPLGATINMDGTAIYQGVCAIFIASCFGIDLTLTEMATIVVTATLASIGTAGVPGAGMVMLTMVLTSVGLPVEGIALVAGVDRIFDMGRTVLNITGDASCAVVVSHLERKKAQKHNVKEL